MNYLQEVFLGAQSLGWRGLSIFLIMLAICLYIKKRTQGYLDVSQSASDSDVAFNECWQKYQIALWTLEAVILYLFVGYVAYSDSVGRDLESYIGGTVAVVAGCIPPILRMIYFSNYQKRYGKSKPSYFPGNSWIYLWINQWWR